MRKHTLGLLIAVVASLAMAASAGAAPLVYTNGAAISVPDNASLSPVSSIRVAMPGRITRVEVRLKTFTHTRPADLDVMVETPSGDYIYLMSDQCGAATITGYNWFFADDHNDSLGTNLSSCGEVDVTPGDNFADTDGWSTAPGAAPVTSFAGLTGTNQTGTWFLHIDDDTAGETGSIGNGWEIVLDTTAPETSAIPDEGTLGPLTKSVSGFPRTISDIDVQLNGISHSHGEDMDLALESPAGTKVIFASDGCGSNDIADFDWTFDDEASVQYPDSISPSCTTSSQRFSPFNHNEAETSLGAVLTGGPFSSSLSAFDGQLANGDWKLYIGDDDDLDIGFLEGYDLAITMRGAKTQTPSNPTFKFKKLGKKSIRATGRATLSGEALTAGECGGSVKSTFQKKVVRRKNGKRVTSYKKVVAVNSNMTVKSGKCGFDISAKLPKAYAGAKLRLVTNYLGGQYIAPFTGTSTEKIKKLKF